MSTSTLNNNRAITSSRSWGFMFAPVVVFFIILMANFIARALEYNLFNNFFGIGFLLMIATGLLTGLISLIFTRSLHWAWRLLILVLYPPVVLISMLIAGF